MKRLFLITLTIILVSGLILGGCAESAPIPAPAPAPAPTPASAKPINLKLSTSFPPAAFLATDIFMPWAKEIEEATGGRIKIVHYGSQSLATQQDQYDALVSGLCDIAVIIPPSTPGRFPLCEVDVLPMLYPSAEVNGGAYQELMKKYTIDTELSEVKFLYVVPLSPHQMSTKKPVHKLEDLKGMKLRIEGKFEGIIIEKLGATGIFIPAMDMYSSIERGLIEGVILQQTAIMVFGLHELTEYRTKCDIFGRDFLMLMNKDVWNNLPPDIQKVFEEKSGLQRSLLAGKLVDEEETRSAKILAEYDKKVGNPGIYVLPEAEKARWVDTLLPIRDEWVKENEAKGLPAGAMLEDFIKLIEKYEK